MRTTDLQRLAGDCKCLLLMFGFLLCIFSSLGCTEIGTPAQNPQNPQNPQTPQNPVTWGSTTVTVDTTTGATWMRMVHLQDGSWLAAYTVPDGSSHDVKIQQSTDDMRTWSLVQTIAGSSTVNLIDPQLVQMTAANGTILLAVSSTVTSTSNPTYSIQVYSSAASPVSFSSSSTTIDTNENSHSLGFYAPFLSVLQNGNIAVFYADQTHLPAGYQQMIGERTSSDGVHWSAETTAAGVADGNTMMGKPYVTMMANGSYMMSFENCSSANPCGNPTGYFKVSADGVTWDSGRGTNVAQTTANMIAQSFVNGLILFTSNNQNVYYSQDYGATQTSQSAPFTSGTSPGFYQTRTNEVAAIMGTTIVFGTMAPLPYHDVFAGGSAPDFTTYGGTWTVSNPIYSNTSGGNGEVAVAGGATWRDYTAQADLRLDTTPGDAGLAVRVSGQTESSLQGYYVGVTTAGKLVINDLNSGSQLASISISGGVTTNTWIHVTAQVIGCALKASAQLLGSGTPTVLNYTDSGCSHMNGEVGLRVNGIAADWRRVEAAPAAWVPSANKPYWDAFDLTSSWTSYPSGTWTLGSGVYADSAIDDGDKSVVTVSHSDNYSFQGDVQMTSFGSNPNAGLIFGVSSSANGADAFTGYYLGISTSSLLFGQENSGWSQLTQTNLQSTVTAGAWFHLTALQQGCFFTLTAQSVTQTYGSLQSFTLPGCWYLGQVGVREVNAASGFRDFSVVSGLQSAAPTIIVQPASETVADGQIASFSVGASGNGPLTYQWEQNGVAVSGAVSPTLTIPAIYTYNNAASYKVVITDAATMTTTSASATLTVTPASPLITEEPPSQSIMQGSTATFAVAATGSIPLAYQWYRNGSLITGATTPSYTTGTNTYAQNNGDSYTVTVTNSASQSTTSSAATLTVAQSGLAAAINVDCSEADTAVAHQVNYLRGVVEDIDLNNSSATIQSNLTNDISIAAVNSVNAVIDDLNLNTKGDQNLFTYSPPNLTYSAPNNAQLVQTLQDINGLSSSLKSTVVQVSGMPYAYNSNIDPNYELGCGANGNYYPLPTPTAIPTDQTALENWIGYLNSNVPGAIWIGTQEPSHTLGYPTSYNDNGCANVPSSDMPTVIQGNINRILPYWQPIAQYLNTNYMPTGSIQLNAGNSVYYASSATQMISAQMPMNYYTIQNYTPSAAVAQALYSTYQTLQQNPNYRNVKVLIDRYGLALSPGNEYDTAQGMIAFLEDEALLMPYADMMYGYEMEQVGIESTPNLMPQVMTWIQAAPTPFRPLTSTRSDLQAFALVQKTSPQRAYVAVWNGSSNAYSSVTLNLNNLNASFTTSNLSVLSGSGSTITSGTSGITVSGDTISGLSLAAGQFLLIALQ